MVRMKNGSVRPIACTAIILSINLFTQTETLVETINTAAGIVQLLLAGEEGMALGTNFHADILLGGTGRENVATSAANRSLFVVGMDAFSHVVHLFLIS